MSLVGPSHLSCGRSLLFFFTFSPIGSQFLRENITASPKGLLWIFASAGSRFNSSNSSPLSQPEMTRNNTCNNLMLSHFGNLYLHRYCFCWERHEGNDDRGCLSSYPPFHQGIHRVSFKSNPCAFRERGVWAFPDHISRHHLDSNWSHLPGVHVICRKMRCTSRFP